MTTLLTLSSSIIVFFSFIFGYGWSVYLFLKTSTHSASLKTLSNVTTISGGKYYPLKIHLYNIFLNIIFYFILINQIKCFYIENNFILYNPTIQHFLNLLVFIFFFFFLFYNNFKYNLSALKNWNLISIIFIFILMIFFFFFFNFITIIFQLEFINIAIIFYVVTSINLEKISLQLFKKNKLYNNKLNWPFYFINSVLTIFFYFFIFAIVVFFFFLFFLEYNLYFFSIRFFLINKSFNFSNYFITLFLIFFFLKIGGAPFFVWKVEVFNNISFFFLFFFSIIYFFFFNIIYFHFFFNFKLFIEFSFFIKIIITINILILIFNLFTALTLKFFFVLSSLINFTYILFIFSVLDLVKNVLIIFYLILFNYIISSYILFFFFIFFSKQDIKFITDISVLNTKDLTSILFLVPVASLAGVAPTLGFFSKYLLLVSTNNFFNLFTSILFYILVVVSTVFYFNLFKIFYNTNLLSISLKNRYIQKSLYINTFFFTFLLLFLFTILFIVSFSKIFIFLIVPKCL